jgi:hypothetical protein
VVMCPVDPPLIYDECSKVKGLNIQEGLLLVISLPPATLLFFKFSRVSFNFFKHMLYFYFFNIK